MGIHRGGEGGSKHPLTPVRQSVYDLCIDSCHIKYRFKNHVNFLLTSPHTSHHAFPSHPPRQSQDPSPAPPAMDAQPNSPHSTPHSPESVASAASAVSAASADLENDVHYPARPGNKYHRVLRKAYGNSEGGARRFRMARVHCPFAIGVATLFVCSVPGMPRVRLVARTRGSG
jgi:hypothetical protein